MSWILLAISAIYEIMKIIYLIRDNAKKLPKTRQRYYRERVRAAQIKYKDKQGELAFALTKINGEACAEKNKLA